MLNVRGKARSAIRIARQYGLTGIAQAVARNLRLTPMPAALDEASIAWEFFQLQGTCGVMIDVGAHYGNALAPFASSGWEVFAFEPDPINRARLLKNFDGGARLRVDARAVGEQSRRGVPFYRSKISS